MQQQLHYRSLRDYRLLFAAGVVLLAVHPVIWLVGTWTDPAYASQGLPVAALVSGLLIWSLSSPAGHRTGVERRRALVLLTLTAGVRLLGQVLGVNVIGAVALVLDVYALGLLMGLAQRRHALSPGWLAVLFAFSLPLERIVQRTLGFGLQQISAAGACEALRLGPDPVRCEGVRILLAGQDVLVDLPCSGARGLLLSLLLFAALAALVRPSAARAAAGLCITLIAAVAANVVRILLLALGLAYPASFGGIDVMAAPWHEGIGFLTLLTGATPILIWAMLTPIANKPAPCATGRCVGVAESIPWRKAEPSQRRSVLAGLVFIAVAAVIVSLPVRPVDVAYTPTAPRLPSYIAGYSADPGRLSAQEQAYFTRYGGSAARAGYGPYGLLVVSTAAPLRHLHAPDECLTGAGHRVRYIGANHRRLPSAIYRSTDPEGRVWRVTLTFVSDRGELATSVGEAVWRWLQSPSATWTMVQRIAPWNTPELAYSAWDDAVSRAMDLPVPGLHQPPEEIVR